jgi:cytochrome c556
MARKYVPARRSQIMSSRTRYLNEMKKTEEDIQPIDIEMWKSAEAKRERKNVKRLANATVSSSTHT